MSNLKDYLGGLDPLVWTDAKAGHLDADVSTRAPASTALVNTTWTDARAGYLDVSIGSRAPASTALTNTTWTDARAAKLDDISATDVSNLDVAVSTRAPASTALSDATWTNLRASKLDYLDVGISTRAPASSALSTTHWTTTKAGYLDADISSRAPSSSALSTSTWTNARAAKLDLISSAASLSSCTVQHLSTVTQNRDGTIWTISSIDRAKSFLTSTSMANTSSGPEAFNYGEPQGNVTGARYIANTQVRYIIFGGYVATVGFSYAARYGPMVVAPNLQINIQSTTIS